MPDLRNAHLGAYWRVLGADWPKAEDAPPLPPQFEEFGELSVSRGKHCSIEESAKGKEGKRYYVAVMRAGDLRRYGLEIASSPENPGHAEITNLIYANRKTDQSVEWQEILAEKLCLRVEGPFPADDNMR